VPRVVVTPQAVQDLRDLSRALGLPPGAAARVQRSLRILERFPRAGRALTGRWDGTRFLIGPWPWMILAYVYDEADDAVFVVAVHDGRSGSAATTAR
jgi:hypothetical protein